MPVRARKKKQQMMDIGDMSLLRVIARLESTGSHEFAQEVARKVTRGLPEQVADMLLRSRHSTDPSLNELVKELRESVEPRSKTVA